MTRWVWDAEANTGVLREIWHGPDVDYMTIGVSDGYETFLVLREEIAQFLSVNGVFRDVVQMVDMVCAQVYAEYICEQGGSYLRADFSAPEDPMQHTRRLLGLVNKNFTVRRIASHGIGVERTFLLDSPRVEKVEVLRHAKVRRANLYFLRGRTGKAARMKERQA